MYELQTRIDGKWYTLRTSHDYTILSGIRDAMLVGLSGEYRVVNKER